VPAHLRPSAPTAPDALLCGDPARALAIAQRVLVQPRMSNHHRGLWGYHGRTPAGLELSVQSTGIGGPSAAVVVAELAELGLRRAIRVGTCRTPGAIPPLGTGAIVEAAVPCDGTSAALGFAPGTPIAPDPGLLRALRGLGGRAMLTVWSRDLHRGAADPPLRAFPDDEGVDGARVEDLQTAALFAICRRHGIAAAALLAVARGGGRPLDDEPLEAALLELAEVAATALQDSTSG